MSCARTSRDRSIATPALAALSLLLALGVGCQASAPRDKPEPSAAEAEAEKEKEAALVVATPVLSGVPAATPLLTVAIRGRTEATSLVIKGGAGGALVRLPLPSGDFCVDVPLADGLESTIEVTGLADGKLSAPAVATVARDPQAAEPPDAYCTTPPCPGGVCPEKETRCDDGKDDDLDGWIDQCDQDCSGCLDDPYEPNDHPTNVPSIGKGTFLGMRICPCREDWFAFQLEEGEWLRVSALRDEGRATLRLFRAEDAEDGGYEENKPVKYGLLKTDTVELDYQADKAGWYYLYAYSLDRDKPASYRLIVR